MEPSTYYQIQLRDLALRLPLRHTDTIPLHDTLKSAKCHAKVKLNLGSTKTVPTIKIISNKPGRWYPAPSGPQVAFTVNSREFRDIIKKPVAITVEIYASFDVHPETKEPSPADWFLGSVSVRLDLTAFNNTLIGYHFTGWRAVILKNGKTISDLHFSLWTAKEERFVLAFNNAPQKNPKVLNIRDSKEFPEYSCSFVHGFGKDRISLPNPTNGGLKQWLKKKLHKGKEVIEYPNSNWSVVIYDQAVTMVASAVMVKPFVSTDEPSSWIISLRARNRMALVPWGKLDVWEKIPDGTINYSFQLIAKKIGRVGSFRSNISAKNGGNFLLDLHANNGFGFVMSAMVSRDGKYKPPLVEVAANYLDGIDELAAYAALAAAVDISVTGSRCSRNW